MQFAKHLDLLLERANVDMTLGLFMLCSVVAAGVAIFLFLIVGQPFLLALVVGSDRTCLPICLSEVYHLEATEKVSWNKCRMDWT